VHLFFSRRLRKTRRTFAASTEDQEEMENKTHIRGGHQDETEEKTRLFSSRYLASSEEGIRSTEDRMILSSSPEASRDDAPEI